MSKGNRPRRRIWPWGLAIGLLIAGGVAVVVLAMWSNGKWNRREEQAVAELRKSGATVEYEDERVTNARRRSAAYVDEDGKRDVVSVVFFRGGVADSDLEPVRYLPSLQSLTLNPPRSSDPSEPIPSQRLTDRGLENLEGLTRLEYLTLDGTQITDAGLEHLRRLESLLSLSLQQTALQGSGLAFLSECHRLRTLRLRLTKIDDAGLANLPPLNLRFLNLQGTRVTDPGLVSLGRLSDLRGLDLSETKVTDEGLRSAKNLRHLRDLRLACTDVSDASVDVLAELHHLESLSLQLTRLTRHGVKDLAAKLPDTRIFPAFRNAEPSEASANDKEQDAHATTAKAANENKSIGETDDRTGTTAAGKPSTPTEAEKKRIIARSEEIIAAVKKLSDIYADVSYRFHWTSNTSCVIVSDDDEEETSTKVIGVAFGGPTLSDSDLAPIVVLTDLESLDLGNSESGARHKFSDRGMTYLKGLSHLREVYLNHTQITDAGLGSLRGLKALETLSLEHTDIRGTGLASLAECRNLRGLYLRFSQVDDAGLASLPPLGLLDLDLRGTRLTDEGLVAIEQLERLQWLSLSDTQITDAGLAHLTHLKDLRSLEVSRTRVNGSGLKCLSDLPQLRFLHLVGAPITDQGLESIRHLPHLVSLDIANTQVSDASVDLLGELQQLECLRLDGSRITKCGAKRLAEKLPNAVIVTPFGEDDL